MKPNRSSKNKPGRPTLSVALMAILLAVVGFVVFKQVTPRSNPPEENSAVPTLAPAAVGIPVAPLTTTFIDQGVAVTFTARPVTGESELSEISFSITDPTTGQPIEPATPPSVWIGSQETRIDHTQGAQTLSCQDKVKLYVQGTLDYRPEIDLNSYFILTLNSDPTISVIDPLGGVTGISQLYAMIPLTSPGEDWVASPNGETLFVTLPEEGQVAVIDTGNFTLRQYVAVGQRPTRIALQPDGRNLWVTNDTDSLNTSGVTILDAATLAVRAQIATGTGRHAIAFSGEVANTHAHEPQTSSNTAATTSYAFISNQQGTVSIIDLNTFDFVDSLDLREEPVGLAYVASANAVFIASASGAVTVLDAATHEVTGTIAGVTPGVTALRFDPSGRWGIALSPAQDSISVIDATTRSVVQTLQLEGAPDKISFTTGYAYIHLADKPEVMLVDLNQLTQPAPLQAVKVIGGQTAPDQASAALSVADAIVSVHEHGGHVLITNPGDQSIYYYMEGMNAPMGSFQTYSRTPRAVMVSDRSIQRIAPGTFQATVKLPHAGAFEAVFLLDTPRSVHCFPFATSTDPASLTGQPGALPTPTLEFLTTVRKAQTGVPFKLKFKLLDSQTGAPLANLNDVYLLAALVSGQRTDRFMPLPAGDGTYEATLQLSTAGMYKVYVLIPSLQVDAEDLPFFNLQVVAP